TDEEDETPVDSRQQTANNQANERPGDACNLINAQCAPPLIRWKGIRQDRRAIGEEKPRADALNKAKDDEFECSGIAGPRRQGKQSTADGENKKPEVIQAHPTKHIRDAAKSDQQRGSHDQIAQQQPEEIASFARGQRIDPNALED